VKDDDKGQKAKGEGLSFAMMLIIILGGITMMRKLSINYIFNQVQTLRRHFIKHTIALFLIGAFLGFFPALSHAATYYISPSGSATWVSCTNINTPCSWQTAMANAVAGDIVYFRGGTYDLGIFTNNTGNMKDTKMYPANSGTASNSITFIAYPGEVPNITGTVTATSQQAWFGCGGDDDRANRDYITWDGFSTIAQFNLNSNPYYENAIFRVAGDHCTLRNSNFTGVDVGNWSHNTEFVRIETATNALIENNYFRGLISVSYAAVNTAAVYFHMLSNTTTVRNNTIENCEGGIYGKGNSANVSIYNNFIYNSSNTCSIGIWYIKSANIGESQTTRRIYQNIIVGCNIGIYFEDHEPIVSGSLIYNNTIYTANGTDDGIHIGNNFINTEVFNNIIYGRNPYLRYYDGTVSYSNYNVFYNTAGNIWNRNYDPNANYTTLSSWTTATGFDATSITTDPLLVNAGGASAADYKLQANSPARTSGRGGSYATVMGAYITGNEIIGYTSDPTLQFSSATYEVSESTATATITVTRSGSSTGAVSVDYATSNGTAAAGSDYTAASGTLSWAPNETAAKTIQVSIVNDTVVEGNETVNIALSNPNGAQISGTNPVVLTITDNDSAGGNGGNSGGGSGGDASGGSGCGFVKDDGKGQKAKGEGLSLIIMLIIILGSIALGRKTSIFWAQDK
jgi:hypothetical protein